MGKLSLIVLFLVFSFCFLFSAFSAELSVGNDSVSETEEDESVAAPGEVLVRFREGVELQEVLRELGIGVEGIKRVYPVKDEEVFEEAYERMSAQERALYRSYILIFPEDVNIEQVIKDLEASPAVEYAEPNHLMRIQER